jgi:hypothetical protein
MNGEDRLEQRATLSRRTAPWDSVRTLFEQAPDALFLLDPEPEAIPDVDRPACRLLAHSGEDLPPTAPRLDSVRSRVWSFIVESRLSVLFCVTQTCQVVVATVSASLVDIEERA